MVPGVFGQQYTTIYEPHFAVGGGWSTTLYVTMTGTVMVECSPLDRYGQWIAPIRSTYSSLEAGALRVGKITYTDASPSVKKGYVACKALQLYNPLDGQLRGFFVSVYSVYSYSSGGVTTEASSSDKIGDQFVSDALPLVAKRRAVYDSTGGNRNGMACYREGGTMAAKVFSFKLVDQTTPVSEVTEWAATIAPGESYMSVALEEAYPDLKNKSGYLLFEPVAGGSCVLFRFSASGNFTNVPTF